MFLTISLIILFAIVLGSSMAIDKIKNDIVYIYRELYNIKYILIHYEDAEDMVNKLNKKYYNYSSVIERVDEIEEYISCIVYGKNNYKESYNQEYCNLEELSNKIYELEKKIDELKEINCLK